MLTLPTRLNDDQWQTVQRTDRVIRTRVPALRKPFLASWEDHHRLVIDKGTPWIFGPIGIDPYANRRGGYPLPAEVATQLHELAQAGAEFHDLAIAHELDPRGPARVYDEVPSSGLAISTDEATRLLGPAPAAQESHDSARRLDERLRQAGRIARRTAEVAVIAAAAIPATMVDPIIFGVAELGVDRRPGRPVLYYPLAAWHW